MTIYPAPLDEGGLTEFYDPSPTPLAAQPTDMPLLWEGSD